MKINKRDDVQKIISSNMKERMKFLLMISHNEIDEIEDARKVCKDLIDSNIDRKHVLKYIKYVIKLEEKYAKENASLGEPR